MRSDEASVREELDELICNAFPDGDGLSVIQAIELFTPIVSALRSQVAQAAGPTPLADGSPDLDYWRQNYLTAVEVGKGMVADLRAECVRLRAALDDPSPDLIDAVGRAIYEEGQPSYYTAWAEVGHEADSNRRAYRNMARFALAAVLPALAAVDRPQPATCYTTEINGEPVRVQGAANPSPEAADAIATVVRAAAFWIAPLSGVPRMSKYGVSFGNLSDNIYIGRLDKTGAAFADKEDHTIAAALAVVEWVTKAHGGEVDLTPKNGGDTYTIIVERRPQPATGAET